MYLEDAKLCITDDIIFVGEQCPRCGSQHYIEVARLIPPMSHAKKEEANGG